MGRFLISPRWIGNHARAHQLQSMVSTNTLMCSGSETLRAALTFSRDSYTIFMFSQQSWRSLSSAGPTAGHTFFFLHPVGTSSRGQLSPFDAVSAHVWEGAFLLASHSQSLLSRSHSLLQPGWSRTHRTPSENRVLEGSPSCEENRRKDQADIPLLADIQPLATRP